MPVSTIARFLLRAAVVLPLIAPPAALAQTVYSEDFTGASTTNAWYFFNGACLTAGTLSPGANPGQPPGCTGIGPSYYRQNLVGGFNGASGSAQTLPDPIGNGALRFTNGKPYGYAQNGAIVSADPFPSRQGVQVTFKTVTYRGDSGGSGRDGADGMSFYLMDGSLPPGIGAWGGSLGYSCSNANPPYGGLVGAYLGLGIDEYGNFLNQGDNTASGFGYQWNRIGLRGYGNVAWPWLNANYPSYYPSTLTSAQQQAAVQSTCRTGSLWNYAVPAAPRPVLDALEKPLTVPDYAAIPGAYKVLAGLQIANESAVKRAQATPILYQLKITADGLLSLAYSVNGGALQSVITRQNIANSNGPMPASFRFGFAGSTGGSTNIHEIMCFRATPSDQSGSSASVNEKQAARVEAGTQAFFAFYNPNNWTGQLTANNLIDTGGVVSVASVANWDAACALTGLAAGTSCPTTGATGPLAAQGPASRALVTWSGTGGTPFQWAALTPAQQNALDAGDATPYNADRLNYLRGDRSNEFTTSGSGLFRMRAWLLGDIVDSSPIWVGPPNAPYTANWLDRLYPGTPAAENTGQSYLQFVTARQTRTNVVYAGANDGILHAFRAGSFNADGSYNSAGNDGRELFGYLPGAVVQTVHSATDPSVDLANTQYGHAFFVDSTPSTGELYYQGSWHTWLVGGLGPGGAALFALDVTDPTTFSESNAARMTIGEWTPANINCANVSGCGANLGQTYGTPLIRRLHNGKWAVLFGNGFGSSTGDAGIYIMTVDPASGANTFYYLSTGSSSANGIASVASADLDGDHVTDYVYAGDLNGNLWRFDLTSNDPLQWSVTPGPLFTAPAGQPITTRPVVASIPAAGGAPRLMIAFGTGRKQPLTNTSPTSYSGGTQDLYGVWDWNLSTWNSQSLAPYASLPATAAGTGLAAPYTIGKSNLQAQVFTINGVTSVREGTSNVVCWQGASLCASGNSQFGWYADLPGGGEQIIYNPILYQGAFIVNSIVPASNSLISCAIAADAGYTYAITVGSGSTFAKAFPKYNDLLAAGVPENATGTPSIVTTAEGTAALVYQTIGGKPAAQLINLPSNIKAKRLTWVELR